MQALTEDGRRIVDAAAARHGFSTDAVYSLLMSLSAGGGRQAQFNHWELGGMGQWSQGGMIMIGDMFNNGLKYRVDALCNELASALQNASPFAPAPMSSQSQSQSGGMGQFGMGQSSQSQSNGMGGSGTSLFVPGSFANRWPAELGNPSSTGSQNDLHYAVFPDTRRLAVDQGGHISVYDTGDHWISGFSQQQGGGQSITFTSQHGLVRLIDLPQVHLGGAPVAAAEPVAAVPVAETPAPMPIPPMPVAEAPYIEPTPVAAAPAPVPAGTSVDEIFTRIERLADLRKKEILTAEEFDAKKAELLARL
jgi:hypothetical protein